MSRSMSRSSARTSSGRRTRLAGFAGLAAAALAAAPLARAHEDALDLDQLMKAFGWDFATAEIKVEPLGKDFWVLFGIGGNIAVSRGANGVLIVDDQFPQMADKVRAALKSLGDGQGDGEVDFIINTHWHFDHAEGNLAFGPAGAWIVSQANSREMMKSPHIVNLVAMRYAQQAYPEAALPVITYDDTMQFHFNGERIDLLHAGPAHTTGDTAVIFRGHNAVHLGDVYNNSGYPFIDVDNGGDLDGVIAFCTAVLEATDAGTRVIPGHGPVATHADLAAYIAMLSTVRDRIEALVRDGATLDAVIAAKPTAEWDAAMGDNSGFVNRAFHSVQRKFASAR